MKEKIKINFTFLLTFHNVASRMCKSTPVAHIICGLDLGVRFMHQWLRQGRETIQIHKQMTSLHWQWTCQRGRARGRGGMWSRHLTGRLPIVPVPSPKSPHTVHYCVLDNCCQHSRPVLQSFVCQSHTSYSSSLFLFPQVSCWPSRVYLFYWFHISTFLPTEHTIQNIPKHVCFQIK